MGTPPANVVFVEPITFTVTGRQAEMLNRLAHANSSLKQAAKATAERCEDIVQRVEGQKHLGGFDSDVLGQAGRQVQEWAVKRTTLIEACQLGAEIPEWLVLKAMGSEPGQYLSTPHFSEGSVHEKPAVERIVGG